MSIVSSDAELREALQIANIPTLLAVLARLSGDPEWVTDKYRPSRTVALDENDSGGFSAERQEEIRQAAFQVLLQYRDNDRPLPPSPTDEEIVGLLSFSLGETIPDEYAGVLAEEAHFRRPEWSDESVTVAGPRPRAIIIGAGISGICAAIAFKRAGIEFSIFERNTDIGGTWLQNTYPGAAVDTPSHLYSYSFAPDAHWSRFYPKQPELLDYLRHVTCDANLYKDITFDTQVVSAQWESTAEMWEIRTRSGSGAEAIYRANFLVSAVGLFNQPETPELPGVEQFAGPTFHAARWDHSADLQGKRVAVIGTGATAMQVVPALADVADQLVVFQRSPQWVAPNANLHRDIGLGTQILMEEVPEYRAWYRMRLFWMYQDKLHPSLFKDPEWPYPERALNASNDRHRKFFTDYLDAQLAGGGEHMREALLPTYPAYGKRILLDNHWFATLRRENVDLVADGVDRIEGSAVVTTRGERRDVDAIVFATGWTARRMLHPLHIVGRSGVPLRDQWGDDDAWAYLGITVPDFPNLFLLYGPNTNLGHGGSAVFNAECQVNYIVDLIRQMTAGGITMAEVRHDVCVAYKERVDEAHSKMIWTHPGMTTYYRNAQGRIVTTSPWRSVDYWAMTRHAELVDFLTAAPATARAASVGEG